MEFDKNSTLKLAKLARLSLNDEQLNSLEKDLTSIVSFIDQLKEINTDKIESHKNFQTKHNLPFPLLSDTDGLISKKYFALFNLLFINFSKRRSFIVDPQGVVKRIYKTVNPAIHSTEIISDLQLLQKKP